MRYNDHDLEVLKTQRRLIAKGYPLPVFGDDSHLGDETWAVLQRFSRDHNIDWLPEVPPNTLTALKLEGMPAPPATVKPPSNIVVPIYDLRREFPDPAVKRKKLKLSAGLVVNRDPKTVTGITIHQTAAKYSVRNYQIQASGGDKKLALARRSINVACHMMAFHDGFLAWPNPLEWYVYHGNGFNSFELGLEIDGNYPGLIGGRTWNLKKKTEVTANVIRAARAGIEILVTEGRKLGMPIQFIHAHRQSSKSRRADPGEELWRKVVVEYAVPVLGLVTEPATTLKNGRPIPVAWDESGVGSY